jgi:hypothetical protein
MADQDDFTFDEQDSDSEEWYEEEEPKKKKKGGGSRSRVLLLLLLLVALGGGAYYYFMILPMNGPGPAAPPKAVVSVKKKPVAIPARKPINPPASAPAPAAPVAKADEKPTPEPAQPTPAAPMPKKADATPAAPVAKADEKPKATPAPAAMPAKPVAKTQIFEQPTASKPVVQPTTAGGAYTLTAGTYLLDSSVKRVSKKIRALGYEPVMTPVKRKVTMTRLKVGTFSPAEAAAKKTELKPLAPGVFGIKKGSQESVYVGSFAVLDKARRYADALYAKGVKLTEEKTQVEQTLQRVTFGSFVDADTAGDAGRQAAAKGVDAKVLKKR